MRFRTAALVSTLVLLAACGKDSTTAPAIGLPGTFVELSSEVIREESWSSSSLPPRSERNYRHARSHRRRDDQSHRDLHSVLERGESYGHGIRGHRKLHVIVEPLQDCDLELKPLTDSASPALR